MPSTTRVLNVGMVSKFTITIDDAAHQFHIEHKKMQKRSFAYADLIDFELNEDGNGILQGRGLSTVAGGLIFGPLGAIAGAAGKRKNTAVCTSLVVRLLVNDLHDSQIVIPFIQFESKKASSIYRTQYEAATSLTSALAYIQHQASMLNAKQSDPVSTEPS